MKVHHLNCGTMRPPGTDPLICHVLLIETGEGLVLVDSGYGHDDRTDPARIGAIKRVIRPDLTPHETAAAQVVALGYDVADVRHVVATHLDVDHIGGASDFPGAKVHTTAVESAVAFSSGLRSRIRYRSRQLDSFADRIVTHTPRGDWWRGFTDVMQLTEISDGIALIAMPGHTLGHAAVAVDAGDHWILHCGDAFFHCGTVDGTTKTPLSLRLFEKAVAEDMRAVRRNHQTLAELYQRGESDLRIVCAHDPVMLATAQQAEASGR
ncbi:MBL fold metallo-hydrolase [Gordonia sp. CPCC 205333]|uniref:MBL fold metallo-hydrolase n=1 Tax=Gordonia sp. CPCC 205333 TaxID=3140790 RepID=UPI003AF3C97C